MSPLDDQEFSRWREEAGRALNAATVQRDAALYNWACFAAEQAAQLAMKALLHGFGRAPWGHDLVHLGDMARDSGVDIEQVRDALMRLARHYIPARYPDAHAAGAPSARYSAADAEEAIRDSESVIALVDRTWKAARA